MALVIQSGGRGYEAGPKLRYFYFGLGAVAWTAIDPHPILISKEYLQSLVDIADPDTQFEQCIQSILGNANAIVLNGEVKAAGVEAAAYADLTTFNFGAQTMFDAVFDQRLQHHAGNQGVQRGGVDVFHVT